MQVHNLHSFVPWTAPTKNISSWKRRKANQLRFECFRMFLLFFLQIDTRFFLQMIRVPFAKTFKWEEWQKSLLLLPTVWLTTLTDEEIMHHFNFVCETLWEYTNWKLENSLIIPKSNTFSLAFRFIPPRALGTLILSFTHQTCHS